MKKIFTLLLSLIFLATSSVFAAYEGGSLSCEPGGTVINPAAPVTITYNGTGTNFANWDPQCHAHMWLIPAEGQEFSKAYTTAWIDYAGAGGSAAWALVPDNQKMEHIGATKSGQYQISLSSLYEFFGVEEADKAKIAQFGMIVRAQYEGDNNRTDKLLLTVQASTEPSISLTIPASVYLGNAIEFSATTSNIENPEINYSVKLPDASEFVSVSSPYEPAELGTYTFKADANVSGYPAIVASVQKDVIVKDAPGDIIVRAKIPADWTDPHIFCWDTNNDGFHAMTSVGTWYEYLFVGEDEVNFLFVDGNDWTEDNNQSVNVEGLTSSACYAVGDETSGKRSVSTISCDEEYVVFQDLVPFAFVGDEIALNASSEGIDNPIFTYSVKVPSEESYTPIASASFVTTVAGVYTLKVAMSQEGFPAVLATAEIDLHVYALPTPITVKVKAPAHWDAVHFYYWTGIREMEGFLHPMTKGTEDVYYEYTFTRFTELNFLVVNGDSWDADPTPEQTLNVENVLADACYEIGEVDAETGNRAINEVDCGGFTSVLQLAAQKVIIQTENQILQLVLEKASNIELYSVTGQLIRSAQNVNSFTQKVNSGVYVLRIDGEARKVLVAGY